jgi:hypothetical protein
LLGNYLFFKDYDGFTPQNLMVAYMYDQALRALVKKVPYQVSSDEWSELASHTHDLEPTNLSRRNILWDSGWIKSTWNDVCRFLHQVFLQYNRLGNMIQRKENGAQRKNGRGRLELPCGKIQDPIQWFHNQL